MKHLNYRQIRALIKKDILVRLRQPWMTFLSIIWPCAIFLSLYILRLRFKPYQVGDCQFPTRQLPANDLLPFFQSYICTIENQCLDIEKYEEVSNWMEAPVTPVLNIVQTLLNEKDLYKAIIDLPHTMEFVSLVTKLATHPKFKYIESNADYIVKNLPEIRKAMGNNFDVKQVFSNDGIFSNLGKVLCGKSFPRSNNIRYVDNILYTPDMNKDRPDKDELKVMPTPYCKQLYLDVTNSNNGKITWKILKPIIQGKIIYGPVTDETKLIVSYANKTMDDMYRLRSFFRSIETSINMLNTNSQFRAKFDGLLNLAKTPFVKAILGDAVDIDSIESVLTSVITDKQVLEIVKTIGDIFECYSVDRFIPVNSEKELEDIAYELAKQKLFYAAFYFDTDSVTNEVTYKLRMEVDNTPVTIENRNRFWFPGPEASFELEMRYHRGFIELQNAIEIGIIKAKKKRQFDASRSKISSTTPFAPDDLQFSDEEDLLFDDFYEEGKNNETSIHHETSTAADTDDFDDLSFEDFDEIKKNESETTTTAKTVNFDLGSLLFALGNPDTVTKAPPVADEFDEDSDFWNSDDLDNDTTISTSKVRRKRQFDGLLGLFGLGNGGAKKQNINELEFEVDDMRFFTKQFPYPKYTRDDFKKGLYLAQAIQMAFFFALIILVSSSVRQKIWFKESGNLSLMRTMGLCESSEIVSWIITTFVELAIVFFLCLVILYTGGIMQYTSKVLIYIYLLIFGLCVISFCFMASTFFSTASIGSVSTVILFLMTFLPYIIIISLGAVLSSFGKFIASLSLSTAFCYAWHYIFRTELQEKSLTLFNAFSDDVEDNDLRFGVLMIIFDTFLYATIGFLNKKFSSSSNKFYKVERKNISKELGAEMKKVTKIYEGCDPNKPAVESVSINFKKDQILCLLGRNGAGKSTVIKLLTGEIDPTLGEIHLPLDYDLITGFKNEQEQVGLCPQGNVLIPDLTAREHLELYAHLKLSKDHRKEVRRVMNNMKLGKYKDYKVSALSGGYKRRLCISIAFLGSPNLVILDEPCSAVDVSARKVIWDLIETLRKNRAVVMSTHDLDEAQHLGDQIIMMKDGRIAMEATTKDLHHELTRNFAINVELKASISTDKETIDEVKEVIVCNYKKEANVMVKDCTLTAILPYFDEEFKRMDYGDLFRALEKLQTDKKIVNFSITSKTLESYYKSIENDVVPMINGHSNGHNNNNNNNMETIDLRKTHNGHQNGTFKGMHDNRAPFRDIVSNLFLKRFLHFRRNYRLLICIMLLPVIFEVIAMTFMIIRPPGDYDNQVEFNRSLYPHSAEFYSKQKANPFSELVYDNFEDTCSVNENCDLFDSSKDSYDWLIRTHEEYTRRRYGGISINQSRSMVWYNNKGYHSMPLYLNILSSAIIKKELNDSSYNIRAINHPLKLGEDELSVSSILQQVADAGISLILLVSFSLVIAGASVFIVNERISGEKLQQQLCGVRYQIYWGVAFVWDFVIYCFAIFCAVIVFYIFNIPIYVEGDNLGGIVLLLFAFGFAMIPYVHLFEKLFNEASFANMSIFCLNVIMALTTVSIVIMFDVLAETDEQERMRNFLNRLFLIFPQHALADGLIEICRNHIMSKIFIRYYIDTYRSPITSDLLRPHLTALIALGIIFIVLNYIVESGIIWTLFKTKPKQSSTELKVITIQNTLTKDGKPNETGNDNILKVENLYKSYNGNEFAVNNLSFSVRKGECYGCLGTNGAGKSTVFSILSGETKRFAGTVQLASDVDKYSISYCPQTNALDPLLTVEEIMRFYGKLRNIKDLDGLVESGLDNFHLKPYRNVLVKNLSGGNRRKLSVACSSFGNLSLVLMDEPVSDMDPITRYLVYKTIKELNDENCSVILTSHSIAEVEDVCHSIGILVDGNMVATGTPERLKKEFGNKYVVTILSEKPLDYHFETDLRKTFRSMKNTVCHQYSAQFLMQVRDFENVDHCHIKLSELIDLLNAFTSVKDLKYTITACMIDQVYESIIKRGVLGIDNNGYVQNEYQVA